MNIIFGTEVANEISKNHTVLELETFQVDGEQKTAYCVISAENITLEEIPDLESLCKLHEATIDAMKRKDNETMLRSIDLLKGHFKGEMDSFYDILIIRATV